MKETIDKEIDEEETRLLTYCKGKSNDENEISIEITSQKYEIGNNAYVVSEAYGVESSDESSSKSNLEKECAICCVNTIETLLLPCKHLCLCKTCSDYIKNDSKKCPICRQGLNFFNKRNRAFPFFRPKKATRKRDRKVSNGRYR